MAIPSWPLGKAHQVVYGKARQFNLREQYLGIARRG